VLVGEEMENKLLEKYNIHHSNNTVIMRADLIRLLAIQEYGGIYLDFDSQVPNWSFFKGLRCEDTFFGPDQWRVL
jgi:mannosyltransferase OCH1-like enzyme